MNFILLGMPYAALAMCIAGLIVRFRSQTTITSQSSQVLESRWLLFGTVPFHIGIGVLFFGHLIPLLFPDAWRAFVTQPNVLAVVEGAGVAAGILCLIGLVILFVRRIGSAQVRAGSSAADVVVLAVLIAQVVLGLSVALLHRWGAIWSVGTLAPYLRSVIALRPEPAFVAGVPSVVMWHLAGAWIVVALLPFTRLVHMLTFPFRYLYRPPQKVVWATRHVN
ncbi:MAG TPA: respiratory nitrate reductase subunit gamma [Thermoanaerobaculia bacterium]|nr:respiratory nitrate reductase subunit gamma [Thermoanaerobaculia bacterium]